jgi:signal transduction histidine kinase
LNPYYYDLIRIEKVEEYLEVIFNSSNQMSEKINEVIWSLNTRNDNLESLIAYITSFAKRFLEPTEIDLRIHIENSVGTNKEKFIPANKRRIIYLICKEILNNIVKHADAKNTIIELILEDIKTFKIKIKDDGKGIKLNENQTGNGLKNIAENLTHINGSYDYITSDNGTEFLISVKI